MISLPPISNFYIAWGSAYPSNIGTVWVTLSPESITTPVVLPLEYKAKTALKLKLILKLLSKITGH